MVQVHFVCSSQSLEVDRPFVDALMPQRQVPFCCFVSVLQPRWGAVTLELVDIHSPGQPQEIQYKLGTSCIQISPSN